VRDWYAGVALQGLLSVQAASPTPRTLLAQSLAQQSFDLANAMMDERKKRPIKTEEVESA